MTLGQVLTKCARQMNPCSVSPLVLASFLLSAGHGQPASQEAHGGLGLRYLPIG